jgi:hypothetical protein
MTTKTEKIAALKLEYPTIKTGSDEHGYTDLSQTDYEATLSEWADNMLADEAKAQAEAEIKATARQAIADRLGLTADELKVLLG